MGVFLFNSQNHALSGMSLAESCRVQSCAPSGSQGDSFSGVGVISSMELGCFGSQDLCKWLVSSCHEHDWQCPSTAVFFFFFFLPENVRQLAPADKSRRSSANNIGRKRWEHSGMPVCNHVCFDLLSQFLFQNEEFAQKPFGGQNST